MKYEIDRIHSLIILILLRVWVNDRFFSTFGHNNCFYSFQKQTNDKPSTIVFITSFFLMISSSNKVIVY